MLNRMTVNPINNELVQIAGPLYGPKRVVIVTAGSAIEAERMAAFIANPTEVDMPIRFYTDPGPFDFCATLEPQGGRYVTTALEVRQREGQPPIQQADLVHVPLSNLSAFLRAYVQYNGKRFPEDELPDWYALIAKDHEAHLEKLGTAYRYLRLIEAKPTAALAANIGVSAPTMRRWLTKAVAAGHLTNEERTR